MRERSGRGAGAGAVTGPAGAPGEYRGVREIVAPERGPEMPPGWQRIVTTIFTIDERTLFEEVMAFLSFSTPAHQKEYAELVDALDQATEIANKASLLRENAKAALTAFEADVEVWQADQRAKARAALEGEKRANDGKGKAITDADVRAKMAEMFPDDYRSVEKKIGEAKGAIAHMDQLHARAVDRFKAIDTMVKGSRKSAF